MSPLQARLDEIAQIEKNLQNDIELLQSQYNDKLIGDKSNQTNQPKPADN